MIIQVWQVNKDQLLNVLSSAFWMVKIWFPEKAKINFLFLNKLLNSNHPEKITFSPLKMFSKFYIKINNQMKIIKEMGYKSPV